MAAALTASKQAARHRRKFGNPWPFVVTLGAVAVWLAIHWPHQSLWYDEALSAWVSSDWARLLHWCTQVDIQVPLHYVALRLWMSLVGSSEFGLHTLSALCGLLAVAGLFTLARQLTAPYRDQPGIRAVPIVAALLLGLSPGFLWVAFEIRAYALALALYAWATVLLLVYLHGSRRRWWVLAPYCVLALGTLYTHYTGIGALAAHMLIALWAVFTQRSADLRAALLRRLLVAAVVIGLGFAPWLPILLTRSGADRSYYAGRILPDQTLGTLLSFKWLARDDFKWMLPDGSLSPLAPLVAAGLALTLLGVVVWLVLRRYRPVIYGAAIAVLPSVMVGLVVLFRPKLAGRYAWPAWLGLDLLLALGLVAIPAGIVGRGGGSVRRSRRLVSISAVALSLVLLAVPWISGQTGHPPDSDFRGAFASIRAHWQPGDVVVLRDGTLFPAAEYYASPQPYVGLPASELTDATHILHAAEAVPVLRGLGDSTRGVWIVAWQGNVMDPQNISAALLETLGDRAAVEGVFGDVSVEYYRLRDLLSTLQIPLPRTAPLLALPDGLTLHSATIVNAEKIQPGGELIAHTWWQRGEVVKFDSRVSIRLYGDDDRTLAQIDQPPSGWFYFPDHWPTGTLILGRYALRVPETAKGGEKLSLRLVVYSANNDLTPQQVTLGTVQTVPVR